MKPPTSYAHEALISFVTECAALLFEALNFLCYCLYWILYCYSDSPRPSTVILRHMITAILGDRPVGHMSQGAPFLVILNR